MEGEPPKQASAPAGAVFLSYASQDAEAAKRICEALRAAGIEVWFDQSELRGGDAWDQSIRKQIRTCGLFLPVISHTTHDRREGYFRLEWKLAIDRCHLMDASLAFLLPVVIDDTRDNDERVPERFREVQWTRLPAGETPPAFVERVQRLLSGETSTATRAGAASGAVSTLARRASASEWPRRALTVAAVVLVLGAVAYLAIERPWVSKPVASAAFAPPPHSIAVLPFVNMSGDKEQEYFSDGLTEELLNALVRIEELQVAARTSAFSFKGKDTDINTIARKLNVRAILEGSVRRAGQKIRITAQLNNAVTGFHLWSQTYDRDLSDVLAVQTEIANAVASALKVTLLGASATRIEVGGTRNPAAFDAYLRASKTYREHQDPKDIQAAVSGYTEALRFDPEYARAYADRSIALAKFATNFTTNPEDRRDYFNKAHLDATRAITLEPNLAQGHLALAWLFQGSLEFVPATQEYDRALALEPGNAKLLSDYGWFAVDMGQVESGLAAARRAVRLDPLNSRNHYSLGGALFFAHRYSEAIAAFTDARALTPNDWYANSWIGYAQYASGDFQSARAAFESVQPANIFNRLHGLAMTYDKLGRHADAEAQMAQAHGSLGGGEAAVFDAMVYAQWGDTNRALTWLETAMRHQDPYLEFVKMSPFLDPLRNEPRFQAIERALKFPD